MRGRCPYTIDLQMPKKRGKRRLKIRARRRSLSARERQRRADALCRLLFRQPLFMNSRRIAVYFPVDGEIDTDCIIQRAWDLGKEVYLPVLVPYLHNRLWFARYEPDTQMVRNRFGIEEPEVVHRQRIDARALDLVLMPLVGFDKKGNRLGMGGGFYDRSFGFLLRRRTWRKPRLVGLAYKFQRLKKLSAQEWDVPLTAVATDRRWHAFGNGD
jgi:5-formyltetrahydrofolate cyclo-ligase